MSTGDTEWEALIKTNNDEDHASLYDKWFMGEGVHQLARGAVWHSTQSGNLFTDSEAKRSLSSSFAL